MTMLVLYLLVLCASSLAHDRPPPDLYDLEDAEHIFEEFINKYNKVYVSEQEKQERFNIFKEQLEIVNQLRLEQPEVSFDIHESSDLTEDEIRSRHFGYKSEEITIEPEKIIVRKDLPDNFDWREHNAVTPIKDQEKCGSCWAFSTTGGIEGAYAVKYKKLVSFSEQQLVDCSKNDTGCDDGFTHSALNYLIDAGGIETESDYPYTARDGSCKFDESKVVAKITAQKVIKFGNDDETKQALIDHGPISIAIWVSLQFHNYKEGILKCPTPISGDKLNHAVLLVGYGTENGVPYWIIKNSWGVHRGDKGYWRVQQGNNPCGMDFRNGIIPIVA